jgi:uncharacterized membrane protein
VIETCLTNPAINCSFYLFQYGGEVVELNLVGALVPLLVSAFVVFHYRSRVRWVRVGEFTLISFMATTAVGTIWGAAFNVISLPGWLYLLLWLLIAVWYSGLRFVGAEVTVAMGELYTIGTVGVFMDDAIRTLLGFLDAPIVGLKISPNIWGAAGPADGIFLSGIFLAFFYVLVALFLEKRSLRC